MPRRWELRHQGTRHTKARRTALTRQACAAHHSSIDAGVRWAAACAGIDVTSFWAKRGYCADACLPPEAWALLVDGFGNSRVMSKEI